MSNNVKWYSSEHVMISIVTNVFWLVILIAGIVVFRTEIRNAVNSLTSIEFPGSRLKLADRAATIRSFTILSNIFVDILSYRGEPDKFAELISVSHAQQLNKFLRLYLNEVKSEDLDRNLVKNAAYIVYLKCDKMDSLELYKAIIAKIPDNPKIIEHYTFVLVSVNPQEAINESNRLINKYPGERGFVFNRAVAEIYLPDLDAAATDFHYCLDHRVPATTYPRFLTELYDRKPDLAQGLREKYNKLVETRHMPQGAIKITEW